MKRRRGTIEYIFHLKTIQTVLHQRRRRRRRREKRRKKNEDRFCLMNQETNQTQCCCFFWVIFLRWLNLSLPASCWNIITAIPCATFTFHQHPAQFNLHVWMFKPADRCSLECFQSCRRERVCVGGELLRIYETVSLPRCLWLGNHVSQSDRNPQLFKLPTNQTTRWFHWLTHRKPDRMN